MGVHTAQPPPQTIYDQHPPPQTIYDQHPPPQTIHDQHPPPQYIHHKKDTINYCTEYLFFKIIFSFNLKEYIKIIAQNTYFL